MKSTPGAADRTHYAEVRTWLDPSIGFPVYVEKTVKETGVVKEFTYFGLRHNGGVWSAHQVEVKMRGQAGSTLLIIDRGSAKANLTLTEFSPAATHPLLGHPMHIVLWIFVVRCALVLGRFLYQRIGAICDRAHATGQGAG